jgi:hypothetical protein
MSGVKEKSTASREQILAKVRQWAIQSGFEVNSISDSKHDFVVEVSETEKLPTLQIIHQKADNAFVLVVGLVNIPETDRMKLKRLMGEHFGEFIWDVKLNLLQAGVDFTVLGPEHDPDAWEVQRRLFLTETSISDFHEVYSRVKYALIGIIWSYKRALHCSEARTDCSDAEEKITADDGGAGQNGTDRTQKVMNTLTNTSIILMSTLMGGVTQVMMETMGTMASGMAGAMGGEEAGEEVSNEFKQKAPEVDEKMREMISEVRRDVYAQLEQKRQEIEPLLSDAAFDIGPEIVDGYDFGLPKLTEELDDSSLVQYSQLLVGEDPYFTEMFGKLTEWMNTLPKYPDSEKE